MLPLVPHSEIETDCCGCLCAVIKEDRTYFECNECGVIVSKEDAARIVLEMDSCDETCPHCGKGNRIEGFSEVFAFTCRYCGRGVGLSLDDSAS
jgi:transposase-like protein